jgi:aryl-alcohol dehydrogenase-like predicted oxidoreductase
MLAGRAATGLAFSPLGIGTYLGPDDAATDAAYAAALDRALDLGINVIDTAINYRSQRSERVVGQVLARQMASGALKRDQVLVCTKAGFIPFDGNRPADLERYIQDTFVRRGVCAEGDIVAGCHCLAPPYLADQIERSRRNLGLETIDVHYLHNPEMQLTELPLATLLTRLRAAFAVLEKAVSDGRVGVYGIATWGGLREPAGEPRHLPLEAVVAAARHVAGEDHHLRAVQLPINLAMPEAWRLRNHRRRDGSAATLLEAAQDHGLYVFTSGSILQGKLARGLPAELAKRVPGLKTDAQRALQVVRSTPGVGTVLCGMKQVAHVEENAALMRIPADPALARLMGTPGTPA